jgi:hypothetical protein
MQVFLGCSSCGSSADPEDSNYCRMCGKAIDKTKELRGKCCGKHYSVIGMERAFCPHCGKQIDLSIYDNRNSSRVAVGVES